MTKKGKFFDVLGMLIYAVLCNSYYFLVDNLKLLIPVSLVLIVICASAGKVGYSIPTRRFRALNNGTSLLKYFYFSLVVSVIWHIYLFVNLKAIDFNVFLFSVILCFVIELVVFWTGIITVYLISFQLGLKHRAIGILVGMIPILNLVTLVNIIKVTSYEVELEVAKIKLNKQRQKDQVCATKYPILMIHGVFFRDYEHLNYWGRIPKELEANGAKIFYGNHSSAMPVAKSAEEISMRIKEVINETGAEKVNIIAHSKGGLDSRAALALGIDKYVASLTTINTPHKGCNFADYLMSKAPSGLKEKLAAAYNFAAQKLGDSNPDFISAVMDLTASNCKCFNETHSNKIDGVFCQSVGSVQKGMKGGRFPLNVAYPMVKHFDGEDDGLVSINAFEFGEKYTLLRPKYKRGITHADMIDLNRENIRGFDVREFYVELVSDLKNRGF